MLYYALKLILTIINTYILNELLLNLVLKLLKIIQHEMKKSKNKYKMLQ